MLLIRCVMMNYNVVGTYKCNIHNSSLGDRLIAIARKLTAIESKQGHGLSIMTLLVDAQS
jgi:hypothetical protein